MESQPQNPEFRNNPKSFHPWFMLSLNIFYSINTNDIQHTYIVNIQRIRTKA